MLSYTIAIAYWYLFLQLSGSCCISNENTASMLFSTEKQNKKQLSELFGQVPYTVIIICCTWIISSECRAECEKYDKTTAAECSEDDETLS